MDKKIKCIVCEIIIFSGFIYQCEICSSRGYRADECIFDVDDMPEVKYSADFPRHIHATNVSASEHSFTDFLVDKDKPQEFI